MHSSQYKLQMTDHSFHTYATKFVLFAGFLFSSLLFLISAHAQSTESYLDRPDILNVHPSEHNLDSFWQALKPAHLEAVAQVLSLYPDYQIYFLARDAELLYDLAKLATQDDPQQAGRIHLLNISRSNMRDRNIMGYLYQEGISVESLRQGKKILFFDTGFSGTIPNTIKSYFPNELHNQIRTHLLASSNSNYPSTRAFLYHLDPQAADTDPSELHGRINTYEYIPRYTDRSEAFQFMHDQWVPISAINQSTDGQVNKKIALKYQEDLKAFWSKPETQSTFYARLSLYRALLASVQNRRVNEFIAGFMRDDEKDHGVIQMQLKRVIVKDFIEFYSRQIGNLAVQVPGHDLSFATNQNTIVSKKHEIIKKYPEWAAILEDPDKQIPLLFKDSNWQMIGNLIDANIDAEINIIISENLFNELAYGPKKSLQKVFIEKANQDTLRRLAEFTFSNSQTIYMTDLIKLMIEKANQETLRYLAIFTFSRPHTKGMTDLIKLVIDKADQQTFQSLILYTFSEPHTKGMTELIRLLLEKANQRTLEYTAIFMFSKSHTKGMTDLIRLVIEKANQDTLRGLAEYTFSEPHTKGPEFEVLRQSLNIYDPVERRSWLNVNHKQKKPVQNLIIRKCRTFLGSLHAS